MLSSLLIFLIYILIQKCEIYSTWNWTLGHWIKDKLVPIFLTILRDEPYGFPDQSTWGSRKNQTFNYKTYRTVNTKHYAINCITWSHINYGIRMSIRYGKWAIFQLKIKEYIWLVIINVVKFNVGIIHLQNN